MDEMQIIDMIYWPEMRAIKDEDGNTEESWTISVAANMCLRFIAGISSSFIRLLFELWSYGKAKTNSAIKYSSSCFYLQNIQEA